MCGTIGRPTKSVNLRGMAYVNMLNQSLPVRRVFGPNYLRNDRGLDPLLKFIQIAVDMLRRTTGARGLIYL